MCVGALATETGTITKTTGSHEQAGLQPDPPRTRAGYRDYPAEAPDRLAFVRAAQPAGLILAEIRGILAAGDHGRPPFALVTMLLQEHLALRLDLISVEADALTTLYAGGQIGDATRRRLQHVLNLEESSLS